MGFWIKLLKLRRELYEPITTGTKNDREDGDVILQKSSSRTAAVRRMPAVTGLCVAASTEMQVWRR